MIKLTKTMPTRNCFSITSLPHFAGSSRGRRGRGGTSRNRSDGGTPVRGLVIVRGGGRGRGRGGAKSGRGRGSNNYNQLQRNNSQAGETPQTNRLSVRMFFWCKQTLCCINAIRIYVNVFSNLH